MYDNVYRQILSIYFYLFILYNATSKPTMISAVKYTQHYNYNAPLLAPVLRTYTSVYTTYL